MSKLEQILVLDPPYELKFKGPFTDVVTTQLCLKNPSDRTVCFKVKTTAPRRYCVRPNSGVLEPGASSAVSVMLQPFDYDPNEKNKHKFMVQTVFTPSSASDMDAVWKDARPHDMMDSKLRCVFELPDRLTPLPDRQSEGDASRATPLSSRPDGVSRWAGPAVPQDVVEECQRLQAEVGKLSDENRQLKDDGVRMRRSHRSDSASTMSRDNTSSSLPSLLVVIAAIFIGFFLGKLVL